MVLPPSRRDILGPPPRDVTDLASIVRHHGGALRAHNPGIDGRFQTPRPVEGGGTTLVGDDGGAGGSTYEWQWDDRHIVRTTGTQFVRLTYEPVEESLFVRWHPNGRGGLPLTNELFSLDGQIVTIPDPGLLASGDSFSFQYQFDPAVDEREDPAVVGVTWVTGDHTSIAVPDGTQIGDALILVMCARVTAMPTDARFGSGFTNNLGGFGAAGVWVGVADGSGTPVSIDMVSSGVGDVQDGAAGLMAITGFPLDLTADETSLTSPTGTSPFTPATPAGALSTFGIAALFAASGISSGAISEQTSNWTEQLVKQGGGAGKCSIYLGTQTGIPAGTWETNGSTIIGGARIMGMQ
jgi:hypothetical protein